MAFYCSDKIPRINKEGRAFVWLVLFLFFGLQFQRAQSVVSCLCCLRFVEMHRHNDRKLWWKKTAQFLVARKQKEPVRK